MAEKILKYWGKQAPGPKGELPKGGTLPGASGAADLAKLLRLEADSHQFLEDVHETANIHCDDALAATAAVARDRSDGAKAAGDAEWEARPLEAAAAADARLATLFARAGDLLNRVFAGAESAPVDWTGYLQTVVSPEETARLAQLGWSSDEVAAFTDSMRGYTPSPEGPAGSRDFAASTYSAVLSTLALAGYQSAESARLSTTQLDESVRALTPEERQELDQRWSIVAAGYSSGDHSDVQLDAIEKYQSLIQKGITSTNDPAQVAGDLDATITALDSLMSTRVASTADDPTPTQPSTTSEVGGMASTGAAVDGAAGSTAGGPGAIVPSLPADGQGSPTLTNRERFVQTLFVRILHRMPEPGEYVIWTKVLDSGKPPRRVARRIWESPEHLSMSRNARNRLPRLKAITTQAIRSSEI